MNRLTAIIGSIVFFAVAPGIVAGLIPWSITKWHVPDPSAGALPLRVVGALLAVGGLGLLIDSFWRFAWQGIGTPAPVAPTRHLVVRGAYRHVRNPMYVAVLAIILGQALVFASLSLAIYAAAIWLATHVFVLLYEEPTLRETYGAEYDAFCAAVPRWIPRLGPAPSSGVRG